MTNDISELINANHVLTSLHRRVGLWVFRKKQYIRYANVMIYRNVYEYMYKGRPRLVVTQRVVKNKMRLNWFHNCFIGSLWAGCIATLQYIVPKLILGKNGEI